MVEGGRDRKNAREEGLRIESANIKPDHLPAAIVLVNYNYISSVQSGLALAWNNACPATTDYSICM